jgi:flagellar basal body rod protein FlgG
MRTRQEELDRVASDLANISTPGYKVMRSGTISAERETFDQALDSAVDVIVGPAKIDFRPGVIGQCGC